MPSHQSSYFQPPPPIRTATSGSQKSVSSGAASPDMLSPTSTYARSPRSPTSPAEDSFFGAITSRIRGRSHSRNRASESHKRSKSPMAMPPEQFPAASSAQPSTAAYQHPQKPRHKSTASQSSTASTAPKPTRPSMSGPARRSTSGSDPWHGRHSNSWLFNDFSVTEHAKDLLHFGRKS